MIIDPHDPERAADILNDFVALCRKHKCVILNSKGQTILAKMSGEIPTLAEVEKMRIMGTRPACTALAVVEEINPTCVVWANVQGPITAKGKG